MRVRVAYAIACAAIMLCMIGGVIEITFKAGVPSSLISVGDVAIVNSDQAEFLLDGMAIGDTLNVATSDARSGSYSVLLRRHYSQLYLIVIGVVSLTFYVLAIYVLFKRFEDSAARMFFLLSMAIAILICTTPGCYTALPLPLSMIIRAAFYLAYTLVPVFLLHFTFVFPVRTPIGALWLPALYVVAVLIALSCTYCFVDSLLSQHYNMLTHELFFVCRSFFSVVVLAALGRMFYQYRQSNRGEERRRLLWVLSGSAVSIAGYVVLWLLPDMLTGHHFLDEEYAIALTITAPVTFAAGIVRFRLLNIEVIVNRSIVNAVVIGLLVCIYAIV